ncbi:Alpha-glucosidase 2 [Eumeta japonica]|uniref:Alpha-glucosidase 2 n=1 Tax=Eumeta variegata TaxID=151549 RepID=A0A4C1TS80_EUMVA|nr:Alpha-glucosidase 2 [Eumeta japonica]
MDLNEKLLGGIKDIRKTKCNYFIEYETGEKAILWFINDHVFRYHMSPTGNFPEFPTPNDPTHIAKITVKNIKDYDRESFEKSKIEDDIAEYRIATRNINIHFNKFKGTIGVIDKRTNKQVLSEAKPVSYNGTETIQTLSQDNNEYFFGGGMQNGRFTHKNNAIEILNTNNWVDGGVASPCPFYWSTAGYGVLRNTWRPGTYDFGTTDRAVIRTSHREITIDAFYFVSLEPKDILRDYFDLTGKPILMPMYSFYEAHLNAFNRDYWVEVSKDENGAILFEDGKYYKCFQPQNLDGREGILESLNGEKDNYQFSARAMVDRYEKHDLPLGWFVPNDGYGCGYGQTDSLDGDIQNLKKFGDYSRKKGVELSVWTESNLHPADPANPKKGERDLRKELEVAGAVALKCDVAWIGSGYSFALNAIEDAADVFVKQTRDAVRPMIITVDGWAGTQRYAGVWSGDQRGGEWEYIRFHIPTYIGSGLSGMPNIGSDMDGIYAGGDRKVNIRDFQWKAFTPIQLVMDGWGWVPKAPFSFDDEVTRLNRAYLKLKSMLMPYNYNLSHEAIEGLPMVRAMCLEFPNEIPAFTKHSQYQYMWGPNILVAPIYNDDEDEKENSIRNGIYLPDSNQIWIDFLTGEKYQGGRTLYGMKVPLWKIPVFIKNGSILPMANANNNPYQIKKELRIFNLYPNGESSFEVYEDDGISNYYLNGESASTDVKTLVTDDNDLFITIDKTEGTYKGMIKGRSTHINLMVSEAPKNIKIAIGGTSLAIKKMNSKDEFDINENVYYYDENYILNPYLDELDGEHSQKFFLIKIGKIDVTEADIQIKITGFFNKGRIFGSNTDIIDSLICPCDINVADIAPTSIILEWGNILNASYYEIEKDGILFTQMNGTSIKFDYLDYNSTHKFRLRSVNDNGISGWSDFIEVTTKDDPYKNVINGVGVTCNLPSQPSQEIWHLTDNDFGSLWHTDWGTEGTFCDHELLILSFDLKNIYAIDKIEYYPRVDAGNGTILEFKWKSSRDGEEWHDSVTPVNWRQDSSVKVLELNGREMRFFKMMISKTVGNFGSGRAMLFYKTE